MPLGPAGRANPYLGAMARSKGDKSATTKPCVDGRDKLPAAREGSPCLHGRTG